MSLQDRQREMELIEKTNRDIEELFGVLAKDFCQTRDTMKKEDTQTARRTFVRALFALIEGVTFNMKYEVLSLGQMRAMEFEGETLDKLRGYRIEQNNGKNTKKYLHLPPDKNLKFALEWFFETFASSSFQKLSVTPLEWKRFRQCINVRNRITHPRSASELVISDEEIKEHFNAAEWFLELYGVANVLCGTSLQKEGEAIKQHWKERFQKV